MALPQLTKPPVIDGDLSEWMSVAHHDGVWDVYRVMQAPFYDKGERNRLTDHGKEPPPFEDLNSRYFAAWDKDNLYLGAIVQDNVNDTSDPQHEPKRWYFKDCICWFLESPRDNVNERFERGDHSFCFVIDPKKPPYGAWWRHGAPGKSYLEVPLPKDAVSYAIKMTGKGGDFVLEARVNLAKTMGAADPAWRAPKIGDEWGFEIVHTDPDGGPYGGHLMIYGTGDDDNSWGVMRLSGPAKPVARKPE